MQQKSITLKMWTILILALFLNLPFISALEISNIQAKDITESSATISWETDEPADSFVHYGTNKTELQTLGDADTLTSHQLTLDNLQLDTNYYYSVESNSQIDDKKGTFYSFQTLAQDTTPPLLQVTAPPSIAGTKVTINGTTEIGAKLTLFINNVSQSILVATAQVFQFPNIPLIPNEQNNLKIEATDKAGNKATWQGTIYSDTILPELKLSPIPTLIESNSLQVNGTITKKSTYEISVNNKSQAKGEGQIISHLITLPEGKNTLSITIRDNSGFTLSKEFNITSDTQVPVVTFSLEKGNNYYEGRAESSINGKTKPNTKVYLFVYRQVGYQYVPKYDQAWAQVTSNDKGEFTFKDVNFAQQPFKQINTNFKQVPQGLQQFSLPPLEQLEQQQQWTYYLFIVSEDQLGRKGFQQSTITINTCYSPNLDFQITSLPQFQAPLRLNPQSLDAGREVVTAVFNFSYRGKGSPKIDLGTGTVVEPGVIIQDVQFEKACTQGMLKDESYKIGCNILSAPPKKIPNSDKSSWYITYNLAASQKLSESKEDFWNEFKKRQVLFPLKVRITYQERDANGQLSAIKTQTGCYDLGYFVDIPIDSKDMLPDFIADEGLKSIDFTIRQIETIQPYLETAIKIAGVTCFSSIGARTIATWYRIFVSKLEVYFSAANSKDDKDKKEEDNKCPLDQKNLFLESTIEKWEKLSPGSPGSSNYFTSDPFSIDPLQKSGYPDYATMRKNSLDKKCKWTASAWNVESKLDQLYKYSCDRFLCRKAPARWTASKDKAEVAAVAQAQQQCAATSLGVPLQLVENCQEMIKKEVNLNPTATTLIKNGTFPCYRNNDKLYVAETAKQDPNQPQIVKLTLIKEFGVTIQAALTSPAASNLFAFKPDGAENFIVGQDRSCEQICKNPRSPGYSADKNNSIQNYFQPEGATSASAGKYGCYREAKDPLGKVILVGNDNYQIRSDEKGTVRYAAGYSADCFLDLDASGQPKPQTPDSSTTGLLQCVCVTDKSKTTTQPLGARTAGKEIDGVAEDWDYREAKKFEESKGVSGTYYPEWRYYKSRDFPATFGQNYVTDYLPGNYTYPELNPHTQHIGTFQTACLTGINARLITLKNILVGLSSCIKEAKVTGLQDVGVCKTIFSQHVCGLIYKSISYLSQGCSPTNFQEELKGTTYDGIAAITKAGFGSIPEAMQSTIKDVQSDYGNAKLNQYFAQGAQGVSQSICMAAFGYDWPIGMDFIMDAAYAFSTKTDILVFPAERELSTYNPSTGTAVYNYNLGTIVMPGCRIRSAEVYLKCIGQEDLGHKGVECGSQGCDCVHATEKSSLEGEKIKYLDQGRRFNLKAGDFVDMKIPSPQRVSSHYRYDHVVVDIKLDPTEKAENCFDEGYRDGKFYYPIIDTSTASEFVCKVEPLTGRFVCPEVISLFGGAGAYLEDPYMSCWDKSTQAWADCNTPNLFIRGDTIKVKSHIMTDGKKYCLKNTVTGLSNTIQQFAPRPLPELAGPIQIPLDLGTVTPSLFAGAAGSIKLVQAESDTGCTQPQYDSSPEGTTSTNKYKFAYNIDTNGNYKVTVQNGVSVLAPFELDNNKLILKINNQTKDTFAPAEISQAKFNIEGFVVHNLIGQTNPTINPKNACTYQLGPTSGSGQVQNTKAITVTTELLQPDVSGDCFNAFIPVKAPAYGKNKHSQQLVLQLEPLASKISSKFHSEFMAGNCGLVMSEADQIIKLRANNVEDANAIYYTIACYIMSGQYEWSVKYKSQICNYLNIFFNRKYITGETAQPYPSTITNTAEYQKIYQYLTQVNTKLNCAGITPTVFTPPPSPTPSSTGTLCGDPNAQFKFTVNPAGFGPGWKPQQWEQYTCRASMGTDIIVQGTGKFDLSKSTCFAYSVYSSADSTRGCPGTQLCCPPTN